METEPLVKETDSRLLYNSLAKKNNANAENTAKNEIKPPETSLYSNRSKENLPKNGVRFKAETSGNTTTNKTVPDLDSIAKKIPPKYSIAAELQRREKEKNSQKLNPPSTITPEFLRQKSKDFSYKTSEGTEITPSNDVMKYLEEYFNSNYNTGKTTVDIVLDGGHLENLHKYLSDGIKNAKRPSNIGKGLWDKQMQNDLKWVDNMFGKSSNFSKALKTIPAITICIDTVRGINENIKNNAGLQETVSDAVINVAIEAGGTIASGKLGAAVGTAIAPGVGTVVGVALGLAIGFAIEGTNIKGKSPKEWLDILVDHAIDGVKKWFK